jgi:hypothetical protein
MALMYPWATKEYLLWNMSLGQIIMYLSIGHEQKHGKREGEKPTYQGKSHEELSAIRDQLRQQYGAIDG